MCLKERHYSRQHVVQKRPSSRVHAYEGRTASQNGDRAWSETTAIEPSKVTSVLPDSCAVERKPLVRRPPWRTTAVKACLISGGDFLAQPNPGVQVGAQSSAALYTRSRLSLTLLTHAVAHKLSVQNLNQDCGLSSACTAATM
jgi:hypothetical protein